MDTSSLDWIIVIYGPILIVLYFITWQLIRATSKIIRVLRPTGRIEATKNKKLSWLCMTFIILGLLFMYAVIFTKPEPVDPSGAWGGFFDNKLEEVGLSLTFFLAAIVTSWFIHPLQKPGPSRFDKYLGIGWIRRHKILTQVILLVLLVLGGIAYQLIALELNKRTFQHARVAIDDIYADIVTQVGSPDNFRHSDTCSQSYVESVFTTKGPIGCSVNTVFIYGIQNESQASLLLKNVQTAIINHDKLFRPTKTSSSKLTTVSTISGIYKAAEDTYKSFGLDCIINYIYNAPEEVELPLKNASMKPFEVFMGCYGSARAMHYPENK